MLMLSKMELIFNKINPKNTHPLLKHPLEARLLQFIFIINIGSLLDVQISVVWDWAVALNASSRAERRKSINGMVELKSWFV